MIQNHPNASAAGGAGVAATLIVSLAALAGIDVPPQVAGAGVTIVSFVVLLLGKRRPVS